MSNQFQRILDLVRRTGDTMVVTDPQGEEVFVVMDLDQYEMLLEAIGFEEDESFEDGEEEGEEEKEIWDAMQPAGAQGETWDMSKMDEGELKELEEQYRQFAAQNVARAMEETGSDVRQTPEDAVQNSKDDEIGEEAFYLEPVE